MNKFVFIGLVLIGVSTGHLAAALAAPNVDEPKITLPVIVPDMAKNASVKSPWDLYSDYLEIDGMGDLAKTSALLAPLHFKPVAVAPDTAFWSVFGAHHLTSDLDNGNQGEYKEAFFAVLAQPILASGAAAAPGLLIVKIWVTDEAAKVAGNEYWGTNKDLAKISLRLDSPSKTVGFTLAELNGDPIFSVLVPTPTTSATANQDVAVYSRFKQIPTSFYGTGVATSANVADANAVALGKGGWAHQLMSVGFKATQVKLVTKENVRFGSPSDIVTVSPLAP